MVMWRWRGLGGETKKRRTFMEEGREGKEIAD